MLAKLLFVINIVIITGSFPLTTSFAAKASNGASLFTNVPEVSVKQFQPKYWLSHLESPNNVLLTPQKILAINQQQYDEEHYLKVPLNYPNSLSFTIINNLINEISTPSITDRFYLDGKKLSALDYQKYTDNMMLTTANTKVKIRFALVTQRTSLRKFPTLDRVFNGQMNTDIDRFQESAVFPGEAVAVLHLSKDQQWAFVQNYHYRAWLQVKNIAFAPRSTIEQFIDAKQRLVVTGAKVFTAFNPNNDKNSEVTLEMGVSLPLVSANTVEEFQVSGQNPYASYIVLLPTRDKSGNLVLQQTLISRSADVSKGFLPLTQANIIKQAFKFLGERYGWGHDFNGRDCSGFIGEIFKSFGLLLPRNTGQQAKVNIGKNIELAPSMSLQARQQALTTLQVGDLIFLPGHVAMFLGYHNNKPYIIHDVHGMEFINHKGEAVVGMLNGVSVTPLLPFQHYVETMYRIKRLY